MHPADFPLRYIENHPTAESDLGLVMAARAGSEAAFAEICRLYAGRLHRIIFSITKNYEDAEDVLQETLMRAYLALESFEGRSKLYSWLTRIAINTSLMALRKRRVRQESNYEALARGEDELRELQISDPRPSAEETYLQGEVSHRTLGAVAELKPLLRTVVQIQMSQECSLKEIARSLDVSVATVKSRLYRARQRLIERTQSGARIPKSRTALSIRMPQSSAGACED